MKNTLLAIIILLLLIANGYQYWTCKDCPVETITHVRTDTIRVIEEVMIPDVYVPQPKTVRVETHVRDTLWLPGDTVMLSVIDTSYWEEVNVYRDTIYITDTQSHSGRNNNRPSIMYEHLIRGELLASNYRLIIPTTTINSTNRTYIREYRHQLYGMSGVVVNGNFFDVALGIQYLHIDKGIQYQYSVGQGIHSFTFGQRIIRR